MKRWSLFWRLSGCSRMVGIVPAATTRLRGSLSHFISRGRLFITSCRLREYAASSAMEASAGLNENRKCRRREKRRAMKKKSRRGQWQLKKETQLSGVPDPACASAASCVFVDAFHSRMLVMPTACGFACVRYWWVVGKGWRMRESMEACLALGDSVLHYSYRREFYS